MVASYAAYNTSPPAGNIPNQASPNTVGLSPEEFFAVLLVYVANSLKRLLSQAVAGYQSI